MQPADGYGYKRVSGTAVGTATITARECVLHAITIGESKTGTVTFYDSASGTNANYLLAVSNMVGAGTTAVTLEPHIKCKKGLTYVVDGTTDLLVSYL